MPLGTAIHNIEITLGRGGQLAIATGVVAKLIAKEGKSAKLKLPYGEIRLISKTCSATVGQVGNVGVNHKSLGRARSKCWLVKRPVVRGIVMNPVDHPHGGGEGWAPIGRKIPATPWGYPALGRTANVRHNRCFNEGSLFSSQVVVNEGTALKRLKPRARGWTYIIKRPTCHITIALKDIEFVPLDRYALRPKTKNTGWLGWLRKG
ncbi:hypothetical protein V6N12_030522 [Hibiscus sabdariffa]|uniref:Large ribosomal subunit protein uL2 C-terminal domain-containing protein n=1 Tax=Hibiscus sabdariffa TaxID=183260 RepID=A0ABR2BBB6_9ROSI